MAKLSHTTNRSYTIEQALREHLEPKVGDVVLALDYRPNFNTITIGELVDIMPDSHPLGKFRVRSLEWDDASVMPWDKVYKIPEGLVNIEAND